MTGPEHYREAEALMHWLIKEGELPTEVTDAICAKAQVHATLALAAATALYDADFAQDDREYQAWRQIAGTEVTA